MPVLPMFLQQKVMTDILTITATYYKINKFHIYNLYNQIHNYRYKHDYNYNRLSYYAHFM